MSAVAPLILDIVDSRDLTNRSDAQDAIREVFTQVDRHVPPARDLWATVGDEFQAIYHSAPDALRATALVRLLSGGRFDCRFGIGVGSVRTIEQGELGPIDDGEGWYRARLALEEVERMQSHGNPWMRTWITLADGDPAQAPLRSYLLTREHIINRMKAMESRIAANSLIGAAQVEIARAEKISQAAVSQKLSVSGGAALIHAERSLLGSRL